MIENLGKHERTTFTTNEDLVDQSFRSPFFEDLQEIHGAFKIRKRNRRVNINQPCQCGIVVYQLSKLRILEFSYDFVDKYFDRRDFKLIQMDTDSLYIAILGMSINEIDEIIRLKLREEYDNGGKTEFLSTSKYHDRTTGFSRPSLRAQE